MEWNVVNGVLLDCYACQWSVMGLLCVSMDCYEWKQNDHKEMNITKKCILKSGDDTRVVLPGISRFMNMLADSFLTDGWRVL